MVICIIFFLLIPLRIIDLRIIFFGDLIGCLFMLPDSIEFTKQQAKTDYFEYWLGKFFYLLIGIIVFALGFVLMIIKEVKKV